MVTRPRKRSQQIACLRGDVAEAQRLARRHIISEDDYQYVAKLIEATAERVTIPTDKQSPFA